MEIAVIGAGIAGLTAAHRLAPQHRVTLFEANDYPGGHTHTVDVEWRGERQAIDTGFIVFNDWTYPNFIALLKELGVASQPTTMGFSVRCDRSGLEYNGSSLSGLFAQRSNVVRPRFWRMLRDILRFNREAPRQYLFPEHNEGRTSRTAPQFDTEPTVAEFLAAGGYSREFAEHYLLPMGSAIWSCPIGVFERFPMRFLVEFYYNHGLLNVLERPTWRVVVGGSRTYVDAILKRFNGTLRLNTPIARVQRHADHVAVTPRHGETQYFDHVIFACHSDQALRMLADPSPVEVDVLREFPYERNVAVLHTDETILPRRRRAWASWNYLLPAEQEGPPRATVTYCMNILQGLESRHVYNVSLNCEERIDPSRVLGRFVYEHPIFTTRRAAAQARHRELIDVNRTSFCGAYWRNGFHEDGVVSAMAVVRAFERYPSAAELEPLAAAGSSA